jgi:ornithine cyclodeaminase
VITAEPGGRIVGEIAASRQKPVDFLYLDQQAVVQAGVLDMDRAMQVVSDAILAHALRQVRQPSKMVLRRGDDPQSELDGRINGLCAMLDNGSRCMGLKWIASFPHNRERGLPRASALIILNSPDTGFPIAVMDGALISAVRTGAFTALGAKHLAPRHTRKIGIIGAGVQARTQAWGLLRAIPNVEQISVYNRTRERAELLAKELKCQWNAPVVIADSIREALRDADVALTVTSSLEPIISPEYIKPGATTIQLAGHECEFGVISQCSKIVVDDWEVLKHRGISSPAMMHAQGLLDDASIYATLGQLLLGQKRGRENESERIHFVHIGMGTCDVALAFSVYRRACELNLGQTLRLWEKPLWA